MYRVCLYETLKGNIISNHVESELESFVENYDAADELRITLLKDVFIENNPIPLKTSISLFEMFEDGREDRIVFNGFITRVGYTDTDEVVNVEAKGFQDFPTLIHETDEVAWVETDAGIILSHLYCRAWKPLKTAPGNFRYEPIMCGVLLGDKQTDTTRENAIRSSWHGETNLGKLITDVKKQANIVLEETYELDYQGAGFTVLLTHHKPEPVKANAVFSIGDNIVSRIRYDLTAEMYATQCLALASGSGPKRKRAVADIGQPSLPRTVVIHKDIPEFATENDVKNEAQKRVNNLRRKLPFTSIEVLADSNTAPVGSFRPGNIITLDLGEGNVHNNIQILSIEHTQNDAVVKLEIRQWFGW